MGEALITCALGPDNVGPLLRTFVDETRANLDAAVYEVGPYYTWLFRRAARAGVHTRLVLDGHPGANTTCTRILAHGPVACRVLRSTKFAAHWKLLTADGHRVAVGTGNLIKRNAPRPYSCRGRALSTVPAAGAICPPPVCVPSDCPVTWLAHAPPPPGLAGTREWWALISGAPRLAGAAMRHFEQAWHQAVAPVPMWEMRWVTGVPAVAAPRPAVPALVMRVDEGCLGLTVGGDAVRRLLKERLRESRRTALVTVPYIRAASPRVAGLLRSLQAASSRGVDTRLLLGRIPEDHDLQALSSVARRGVQVRVMDPLRSTTGHAKGILIDAAAFITSSNWSEAGLGGNREATLSIDHAGAAGYYRAAFERDWAASPTLEIFLTGAARHATAAPGLGV